jgi:hypothetical protein
MEQGRLNSQSPGTVYIWNVTSLWTHGRSDIMEYGIKIKICILYHMRTIHTWITNRILHCVFTPNFVTFAAFLPLRTVCTTINKSHSPTVTVIWPETHHPHLELGILNRLHYTSHGVSTWEGPRRCEAVHCVQWSVQSNLASGMYPKCTRFEPWPGHRVLWLKILPGVPHSLRQNPREYLKLAMAASFYILWNSLLIVSITQRVGLAVPLSACIMEETGLNLRRNTRYSHSGFSWFRHSRQENSGGVPRTDHERFFPNPSSSSFTYHPTIQRHAVCLVAAT